MGRTTCTKLGEWKGPTSETVKMALSWSKVVVDVRGTGPIDVAAAGANAVAIIVR